MIEEGKPAPDFELPTDTGTTVRLSELRGKPVVLYLAMIAEADLVVTRVTAHGTHNGVWLGIEPTRSDIQLHGINIDRIEAGLIAEHWGEADTVGMLYQMGVDPFVGRRE